ncbi:MAG: heat-shock protein HtpX, partial [Actinomycetota bacterium]|nr:heat-shock protein HtpX [Actinomycetota bacterium]
QMAAGWLRHLAGDAVRVLSAGSEPSEAVNPAAVAVMAEVGIDIAGAQPRRWTPEMVADVDVVVSMGCGDECTVVPDTRLLDWNLADPAGHGSAVVRGIRDDIELRVRGLLDEILDREVAG